jgi:tRNA pseudouridine55 synthase
VPPSPTGVLLVDKPIGLSSHDVVSRVRRALSTRQVGHAGTLDPMASGLLVVLAGEATKLSGHLTGDDKRYLTTVSLGLGTDSLDADGQPTELAEVPDALRVELSLGDRSPALSAALAAEAAREAQLPPAISAIHVDGQRAYERARRGEDVALPPRPVAVRALRLARVDSSGKYPTVEVELLVSKGYYVRSFGRDLGRALGLPAHLSSLRRLASGPFDVAEAVPLSEPARFAGALLSLESAVRRAMRCAELTELGEKKCRWGQILGADDFATPPPDGLAAWFFGERLVALGEVAAGEGRVARGFAAG